MHVLGYIPSFHVLIRSWLSFKFWSKEDVVSFGWIWGLYGIFLRNWDPNFDPKREPLFIEKLCVIIQGLLWLLWRENFFIDFVGLIKLSQLTCLNLC